MILCYECHTAQWGTSIEDAHVIRIIDKCEKCHQIKMTVKCHCYLRTEHMDKPAPLRGRTSVIFPAKRMYK